MLSPKRLNGMSLDDNTIKILMIYNNSGKSESLKSAWGLSVWIEKSDSATLFDTGGDPSILWENMTHSDLDISKLSNIVISHNHWDHKNGLGVILEKTSYKPVVCIVENDLKEFEEKFPNAKIKSISGELAIEPALWTTGKLLGSYNGKELYEQSLILTQYNSVVVLTGCSHSGIVDMVKTLKRLFPNKKVELVAGGFHLVQKSDSEIMQISDELKKLDVNKIAPSHCTGENAINYFEKDWGDRFINLNIGNSLTV